MAPDTRALDLTGTCAFRLMPHDPLAEGPSSAAVTAVGEQGFTLHYTWVHPTDGAQRGVVLVGGTGDDGAVEGALFDTWHQQPGLMPLSGRRSGDRVELAGTYMEEWGWMVAIELADDAATMTMCNVVPESALATAPPDGPSMSAGPYDVMVASWQASPST
ncbi:hypothetical protein GCM10022415_11460 [Knoellia locipacati]|uniref:Uncharacterized protein n=1 Tax=Knoellia locipacati TaxID=882824 RepID=A0A512SYQ8_9MICO|nr:hypothetical protein [Knoellia locipacati]GEQ13097.1 hypothetical protein KLO01_11440 [Knoellia locipacati]